jgi:hypothetical protein
MVYKVKGSFGEEDVKNRSSALAQTQYITLPAFERKLYEIPVWPHLWSSQKVQFIPALFINGVEKLRFLETRKDDSKEERENKMVLKIILDWLTNITTTSLGRKMHVILSTSDSFCYKWLESRLGVHNITVQMMDFANKKEAKGLFDDIVRNVKPKMSILILYIT